MHSSLKLISVIIPSYNSETFIERAIESVLRQTYKNYEIILVDNNSSDNTQKILYSYAKKYPDLIRVLHEFKQSAPAARNKGLSEAKGEWIQYLDSDDELLPEKLEHQLALTNNGDVDLIIGKCYKHKFFGNKMHKWVQPLETENAWRGLLSSKLGNTCANLWNRKALLAVGGWNENMSSSEEYELLFRLLKNKARIKFSSVPLLIVHVRDTSVNRSFNNERTREILNNFVKLRLEMKEYLKENAMLTGELERTADISIYFRLWSYRKRVPEYVSKVYSKLKVPLSVILKRRIKSFVLKAIRT